MTASKSSTVITAVTTTASCPSPSTISRSSASATGAFFVSRAGRVREVKLCQSTRRLGFDSRPLHQFLTIRIARVRNKVRQLELPFAKIETYDRIDNDNDEIYRRTHYGYGRDDGGETRRDQRRALF